MTAIVSPALVILAEVFVPGHPKTKGSMEHIGQGKMRESVANSGRWRKLVAERVRADMVKRMDGYDHARVNATHQNLSWCVGAAFPSRVGVRVISHVQAPSGWYMMPGDENLEGVQKRVRQWLMSSRSGDVDKYARNVLDALTDSGIIADDSQVWDLMSSKRLAGPGAMPGQTIQVWIIPESMPW